MVTATRAALSGIEKAKPVTKEDVLRLIPQFEIPPIFLRPHLDREYVIGTIGDRGGGKSGSDAVIGVVDCMFKGKTVYSNMDIGVTIEIDDETARKYGLNKGGTVCFISEALEKDALLKLDEKYKGGAFVIEEINVQYSNVRRFMSNTNVDFNEVMQQLRKWKTPLIYNVIDEMFVDPQLRALTDIFVKTYDTAFDVESLAAEKQTGLDFCWQVYPLSGYLCGEQGKYKYTNRTKGPVYFHFGKWRGLYNTMRHQEKGKYSCSTKEKNKQYDAEINAALSPEMVEARNEYGWLAKKAIQMRDSGITELDTYELTKQIGRPLTRELRAALQAFGIHWISTKQKYEIEDFVLSSR